MASKSDGIRKLEKLINKIKFTMMTTACGDGSLRSRPMMTLKRPFDGELWFFTDDHSAKVDEINQEHHVNLAYADPSSNTYVSISGRANVVHDRKMAAELWSPAMKSWFPDGLDDPRLGLLRVTVEQAEFWDSPSSTVVHLYGMVKAALTGKQPTDLTDNRKLRVRRPATPTRRRTRAPAARR
jgi:general stress protein 26